MMGGIELTEIMVVDSDNLLEQRVLTVPTVIARLWVRDSVTGDLRWCGPKDQNGYGVIRIKAVLDWLKEREWIRSGAHSIPAHTCNYVCYHHRPIQDGWTVDHREIDCPLRHPLCGWPLHLEAVPNGVNAMRGNYSNYRPMEHLPPLFDPQFFDRHVLPHEQRTRRFTPAKEKPLYRARRWDERQGLDHERVQAAFSLT